MRRRRSQAEGEDRWRKKEGGGVGRGETKTEGGVKSDALSTPTVGTLT